MKKLISVFILFTVLLSCTTKKNTFVTRTYHNTTSRFNILFNGKESYQAAVKNFEDKYQYDYNEILPVYLYHNKGEGIGTTGETERTLEKTSKLITMHSITVKPELKGSKPMSAAEKEFYDKNEFNKWVDDNYLLMGKTYVVSGNYILAKETFRYIIRQFPNEEIIYPAQIWLARTLAFNKEYRDAETILSELEFDTDIPKHLNNDLYSTLCDYNLRLKQYGKAAEYLEKALEHVRKKDLKIRYHFILAQLYLQEKEYNKTLKHFREVISLNPPYEMAFQAKIQSAMAFQSNSGRAGNLKDELRKMLKDDKNIEYRDQIYFALGNIEYRQNNIDKAIEYYLESTRASINNPDQKARTFLKLAEIYYARQNYLAAQANYDSTVSLISPDYPDYNTIYNRSLSLTKLAKHTGTFHLQDSVLKLSSLSEDALNELIDKVIEQVIADEERAREEDYKKQEEARIAQEQQMMSNRLSIADATGGWYFYNNSAKTSGIQQFKAKWGNRKLEDDWRRKNKNSGDFGDFEEQNDDNTVVDSSKLALSNKSREYYLLDIPFTDSAKAVSHQKIQDALYNMGQIYSIDLSDFNNATVAYEELVSRYPDTDRKLQAYYNLYLLNKETGKSILVEAYKNKILSEFPESRIAKIIADPAYAEEILKEENLVKTLYAETYQLYLDGDYARVQINSAAAIKEFKDHALRPNFELLNIMSQAQQLSNPAMEKSLTEFIQDNPDAEVSNMARQTLAYIKNPQEPGAAEDDIAAAEIKVEYIAPIEREQHLFIFAARENANINQMVFNLINFNLDNYSRQNFKTEHEITGEKYNLAVVRSFKTKTEAMNYRDAALRAENVFRDVTNENFKPLVISTKNYRLMKESGVPGSYYIFYRENY